MASFIRWSWHQQQPFPCVVMAMSYIARYCKTS